VRRALVLFLDLALNQGTEDIVLGWFADPGPDARLYARRIVRSAGSVMIAPGSA
jgi:hypothetical protein